MVEKYIETNIENGKSPEIALRDAFQQAYLDTVRDELLKKNDRIEQLSRIPLLAKDLNEELGKWGKIEHNQRTVLKKINEVVVFSTDGVKRNQDLIDRSTANAKLIIDKAVRRYLNKVAP